MNSEYLSWYPGHIAKAERELREKWLPLLDVVIELVDARVPLTGRYHDREIFSGKATITVYNKGDLCNLEQHYPDAAIIDARRAGKWKNTLKQQIEAASGPVLEKLKKQGRKRKLRIGISGLPNVGKSTFLNTLMGRGRAKTGNLPGVTRQMQFVSGDAFDLLDAPGICPVKIPQEEAYKLALCQILPDKLFNKLELAQRLSDYLELGYDFETDQNEKLAQELMKKFRKGEYQVMLDQI